MTDESHERTVYGVLPFTTVLLRHGAAIPPAANDAKVKRATPANDASVTHFMTVVNIIAARP
ncbi:hypothetical protein [Mycolicibacterium lutetiense]|uniref:Uncharacterized protein n=1 Tax=Mycolicibacterium lutetiense TaxID=1641992 RepID=A0ABS4ZSV2_9MYCO|nr:hypothetical protein [Mycolicibacterium lutetiense]MBP2452500.1 hypothetical protein [Mycolicibacterium lutetiense]